MSARPCPRCASLGFPAFRTYQAAIPARPARFFGLIPALPALGPKWIETCGDCFYERAIPARDNTTVAEVKP